MNKLGCNNSGSIQKLSCDRRDTDCIKAPLMGEPLAGDRAINIDCLTKTSLRVKTDHKKHLVCIDPRVENYQHLARGVKPGTEIIGEHLIFVKTLLLAPSFFLLPLFSWLL